MKPAFKTAASIASLPVILALAGCGSGSYPAQPARSVDSTSTSTVTNPNGSTTQVATTYANVAPNTVLPTTARRGLESFTVTGGTATLPTGSINANPTMTFLRTGSGMNLTLPDGKTVAYLTGPSTVGTLGTQRWKLNDQGGTSAIETKLTRGLASTLTYATYGIWIESNATTGALESLGVVATGIPTAAAQKPATGTATFNGFANGWLVNATIGAEITGTATLTADFGANTIAGTVTAISTRAQIGAATTTGLMNDITLAGGTISGTNFSGTAATVAATAATTVPVAATGTFGGSFYGLNAAEVAGSITMTGGGSSLIASFGARR